MMISMMVIHMMVSMMVIHMMVTCMMVIMKWLFCLDFLRTFIKSY